MNKILLSGVIVATLGTSYSEARADIPFGTHRVFHGMHQTFRPGHPHTVCSKRHGKIAKLSLYSVSEGGTYTIAGNGAVVQYSHGIWYAISPHTGVRPGTQCS